MDCQGYFFYLKVWGCPTKKKQTLLDKLEAKSDRCLFVEYPKEILNIISTKL